MALDTYQYGADIADAVASRASQLIGSADGYYTDIKAYVRRAYWEILDAFEWPFALAPYPGTLTLQAAIQSVNVASVVANQTYSTVTSTSTLTLATPLPTMLQTTSMTGRKIANQNNAWYRIKSHTAGSTTMILDAPWAETLSSGPMTIYQDEYTLDEYAMNVHGPFRPRNGAMWWQIPLIDEPEFRMRYGTSYPIGPGPVEAACLIRRADFTSAYTSDDTNYGRNIAIQVAPWPSEAMVIEYDYTAFQYLTFDRQGPGSYADPNWHDIPLIPRQHRYVIADRAVQLLLIDKKDPASDQYGALVGNAMAEMIQFYLKPHRSEFHCKPRYSLALGTYGSY